MIFNLFTYRSPDSISQSQDTNNYNSPITPIINLPELSIYFQKSNINYIQDETLDLPLFESKYIRKDEKDFITYTKRGIIKFAEELLNQTDYNKFYDKNNLIIFSRKNVN